MDFKFGMRAKGKEEKVIKKQKNKKSFAMLKGKKIPIANVVIEPLSTEFLEGQRLTNAIVQARQTLAQAGFEHIVILATRTNGDHRATAAGNLFHQLGMLESMRLGTVERLQQKVSYGA